MIDRTLNVPETESILRDHVPALHHSKRCITQHVIEPNPISLASMSRKRPGGSYLLAQRRRFLVSPALTIFN